MHTFVNVLTLGNGDAPTGKNRPGHVHVRVTALALLSLLIEKRIGEKMLRPFGMMVTMAPNPIAWAKPFVNPARDLAQNIGTFKVVPLVLDTRLEPFWHKTMITNGA